MNNMPTSITPIRLALYGALSVFLLLGGLGYTFMQKKQAWENLEGQVEKAIYIAQKIALKQQEREKSKAEYQQSKSHYLESVLHPWILLEKEQKNLARVIDSPGFCGNKSLENRLHFLSGEANRMQCKEQLLYTSSHMKEIEVSLQHPIEASLEDVEGILRKVEGKEPEAPLLLVTQFHLKRKKPVDHNEVFEVNFTILKRELNE